MESASAPIPVVICALLAAPSIKGELPLAVHLATCVVEAQEHDTIVLLPMACGLRLATLGAVELEAIGAWLQGDREQLQLLVDLRRLHGNPEVVAALQDMLDQAGFRVVSVALWALVPVWVAVEITANVAAGPLPCAASAQRCRCADQSKG